MNNNRKRYFHIDSGTSTNQIFALLDTVQSVNEDEIDGLMNYWWILMNDWWII